MRWMSLSMRSSILPCCTHLFKLLADAVVEHLSGLEQLPKGLAQIVERVVHLLKAQIGIAEAGIEEVVGESLEQVFDVHLGGQIAVEFGIANALHGFL